MNKRRKIVTLLLTGALVMGSATSVFAMTPHMDTSWVPKIDFTLDQDTINDLASKIELVKTPKIEQAMYYHSNVFWNPTRLQVRWSEVDGADSYEVKVTKKDGTSKTYTTTYTSLVVNEGSDSFITDCIHGGTVKVRAIDGPLYSDWTEAEKISCNSLH